MSFCLFVSLSVCMSPKFLWTLHFMSKYAEITRLQIQLHLDKNWCWLDIGGYRPTGDAAMLHFPRIFRYLKYLIFLGWIGWVWRRTRATRWAIANALEFIPEYNAETCHYNFDPPRRGWLPRLYLWVFCVETNQTQMKPYLLGQKVSIKFLCTLNSRSAAVVYFPRI